MKGLACPGCRVTAMCQVDKRGSYVGCIAGALTIAKYQDGLAAAGLINITITPSHQVADA